MIDDRVISQFNEGGKLGKYGYTVSSSPYNMNDTQRQQLLKQLINEDKISVYEIVV